MKVSHHTEKSQPQAPQTAKRGIGTKADIPVGRPTPRNDRNPERVRIRQETGGKWVKIDERTHVYRMVG